MSLVGPYLNTTSTKKRVEKVTKAQQAEFERGWRDRNIRLKQMQLPKETFEQYMDFVYGRAKKEKSAQRTIEGSKISEQKRSKNISVNSKTPIRDFGEKIPSLVVESSGPCSSPPSPSYTGTKMIGIAQMAKSNAVPVFSQDEITNIARMRR
jgi:hypothetical protein